ncbi:hypothetical protein L226DRAFT_533664 [Lentinus tigrinus ALCF2SS1-7]|uniref:uncharacterized protein n=1 Tax=Lentinus tigrinus ALCF2SS1-7 TaxID=1328758 RepID=UPI001165CAD8|nr:hypothetical protein L226DRAFT_533664 [Lentinus tigrinus ALCF2SS1-7]
MQMQTPCNTLMQTSSHNPLSSGTTVHPWLPSELVSQILAEVWNAPQSTRSRSELFKRLCKVNKTWLTLFVRVAMRDVHLSCPLDAEAFLRVLPERTNCDLFTTEASQNADRCRSITFHVDGRASDALSHDGQSELKLFSGVDPACNTISNVLYTITTLDSLPNLRHITIKYINWGYEDIFLRLQCPFPPQVTHLSIDYGFSHGAVNPLISYLKHTYSRQPPSPRTILPNVRHLSMSGVPSEVVADMLEVCPSVETLEIVNPSKLSVLAPLPPSVRTIVMRYPWWPTGMEETSWWMLGEAMRKGLFHPSLPDRPQIILRSGTPNPWSFIPNWRLCKHYGVDLVYDRDETRTW